MHRFFVWKMHTVITAINCYKKNTAPMTATIPLADPDSPIGGQLSPPFPSPFLSLPFPSPFLPSSPQK